VTDWFDKWKKGVPITPVEPGAPPVCGSSPEAVDNSADGAAQIAPHAASLREQVFKAIEQAWPGGLTDREIQEVVGIKGDTQRPRRHELWKAGRVKMLRDATGTPIYRETGMGNRSLVWVVGTEEACPTCGRVYTKTDFLATTENHEHQPT
jgi:hypothetical protein